MYVTRLREYRKEKGYSQKDVYIALGMKQPQYSRYESGEDEMKIGTLVAICKVLNVSADYILGLSDEPIPRKLKNQLNIIGDKNKIENINMN